MTCARHAPQARRGLAPPRPPTAQPTVPGCGRRPRCAGAGTGARPAGHKAVNPKDTRRGRRTAAARHPLVAQLHAVRRPARARELARGRRGAAARRARRPAAAPAAHCGIDVDYRERPVAERGREIGIVERQCVHDAAAGPERRRGRRRGGPAHSAQQSPRHSGAGSARAASSGRLEQANRKRSSHLGCT
jgi:hypothetical protein